MLNTYLVHCIVEHNFSPVEKRNDSLSRNEGSPLEPVWFKDIAAIVEKLEIGACENQSREDLTSWLVDFQQTNIQILQQQTMIPFRFGVFIDSQEEIEECLAIGYQAIKSELIRMRGKGEFAVQAIWNLPEVLAEIRREEGVSETSVPREAGKVLFESSERKKKTIVEGVHQKLSAYSSEAGEMKQRNESVIFNRSYLVELSLEKHFDRAMTELGRVNKSYLRFKYVGPLPPNSFVSLKFKKERFELIDWARKTLDLPETVSFAEVKSAYRKKAIALHPDKNIRPIDPKECFEDIGTAYQVLKRYCGGFHEPGTNVFQQRSLTKPEVEKVFVMTGNP